MYDEILGGQNPQGKKLFKPPLAQAKQVVYGPGNSQHQQDSEMYQQWRQSNQPMGQSNGMSGKSSVALHSMPGDDRHLRYQEYLEQQKQPNKDQNRYIAPDDIEGAQPKKLNQVRGKKKANFFDDKKLNQYYHDQKYQLVDNNLKQQAPETQGYFGNTTSQSNYNTTNQLYQSRQGQLSQQQSYSNNNTGARNSVDKSKPVKFDDINNFDRLYNKRIDWKPILIQEKQDEKKQLLERVLGESGRIGSGSMNSTLSKTGAQMMMIPPTNLRLNGNLKNESQVNYCISLGLGAPQKNELTSNSIGKFANYGSM
ncbi:UNKNOWN [Stylonychia lemnae]|uniref:Uncharacterized protein n=1 Tax=Stylonychia lemnae TaxID=5949 RepID=A0A077ZV94_STYLE|nr:UNKNOWN [Stylonychia lemnae]|eukprot:CDW72331.1 UNKNOWN [Stylonychia lemnae]